MNTDIVLYTVPHSGTRFTLSYFEEPGSRRWNTNLGKLRRITDVGVLYYQQHTGAWLGQQIQQPAYHLQNKKVIITVRHPRLTLNSFMARGKTEKQNVECWKSLIEWLPKMDHYIFDIGCREEIRFEQMYGIVEHIGADSAELREITHRYVDEWKPLNVTQNKSILSDDYDYSELDFATDWYESLPSNDYS